jgi:hypothetical protein
MDYQQMTTEPSKLTLSSGALPPRSLSGNTRITEQRTQRTKLVSIQVYREMCKSADLAHLSKTAGKSSRNCG